MTAAPHRRRLRALVVGMDGTIGRALHNALLARGEGVTGTSRRSGLPAGAIHLDLAEPGATDTGLPPADIAFFCAGMTSFKECRAHPTMAHRVNATAPAALAAGIVRSGSRVVLLSTSAVLDCAVPRMLADRPLAPASAYGKYKAQAETEFLALGSAAAVLRLTKVLTPQSSLFAGWIGALARSERVSAFYDLRFSPIALDHVLGALLEIGYQQDGGVFQASGAADISYFDAARHLAGRLGAAPDRVEASSALESGIPAEEVLAYTSLDTRRLSKLYGFTAPDPRAAIDAVFARSIELALAGT